MRELKVQVKNIYQKLYELYGPQGWWPLVNYRGTSPNKTGVTQGYHPLNYDLPEERNDIYEVILGAILTQNTTWQQANKAIQNLNRLNALKPENLLSLNEDALKSAIRTAGFLNQKSNYLKAVTKFYIKLDGTIPTRKELLRVKGVGNETADSILLYAFKQPEFVVDAYTTRIFTHLGIADRKIKYLMLKELFQSNLAPDVAVYQEYHALLVEHAKRYYSKKPYGVGDPLKHGILR